MVGRISFDEMVREAAGNAAVRITIQNELVAPMSTRAGELQRAKRRKNRPSGTWIDLLAEGIPEPFVGEAILNYCQAHADTRAFVLFALDQPLIDKLLRYLKTVKDLKLVYAAQMELSRVGCENLIELCYGEKPFFERSSRSKMARERFVFSSSAVV